MKIIDPRVLEDLRNSKPLQLNLGCGDKRVEGFYGVDLLSMESVSIQADLNEPFDKLPDNSVSAVVSSHTFEHIRNFPGLMKELHRVLKVDGVIKFVVPHFSCSYYYSDPTHVRFFGLYTMSYFSEDGKPFRRRPPNFYTDCRFRILDVKLTFCKGRFMPWMSGLQSWLFNKSPQTQAFYERCFCWVLPAYEIQYVVQPVKSGA